MNPPAVPVPEPKMDLAKDLAVFERLPAKTKELELLQARAEKATGLESAALHLLIRDKTTEPREAGTDK
jgi:hypothetical protein